MSELIDLAVRAGDARLSVVRTLRGVNYGPTSGRQLLKRFHHVLRRAKAAVMVVEYDQAGEHPRKVELVLSRAGLAGHLKQELRALCRRQDAASVVPR